ncbi:MAG: flagellin, partial [Halieaceae bacterium]
GVAFDFDLENFSFNRFASFYRGSLDLTSGAVAVGDTIEILGSAPFGSNYNTMWNAYATDYPDQSLTGRQSAHVYNGTITLDDAEIVALMNSGDTSRDNMDTISSYLTGELQKIDGFESAGVWWSTSGAFYYHNPFANGYRVDIGSISSSATLGGGVVDPIYADNLFHVVYDHVTKNSIEIVDARLAEVAEYQAKVGAAVNALYSVIDNLSSVKANTEGSRSRILDADYAKTTAELARAQIIQQAGMAMTAQANALPEVVLTLLGA